MTAVLVWLRLDLRRRLRSLTVLALLVAVASGTVLTAVAGARRGESALPRLAERTLPTDAVVLPNQPGFDWAKVRAMPEVEALSGFALGVDLHLEDVDFGHTGFVPADAELMRTVERPVVFEGRVFDPAEPEAVISPGFEERYGKGVGDDIMLSLYTPEQVASADIAETTTEPLGPKVPIRIVGVVRSPWFSGGIHGQDDVAIQLSPGLFTLHRENLFSDELHYVNALVRLRGGESALPAFERRLAQVTGRADIDVWNFQAMMRNAQRSFTFQARCLLAFGLAALVASLFLVGQTVARYTSASVADLQVVRALGMTSRQALMAATAGPFLAASLGAVTGVVSAGYASRWFPIGTAALEEPAPGTHLDWPVLVTGLVAIPLLVLAGAAGAAWLSLTARQVSSERRSAAAAATARAGLPVPVVVGTRFALETGRGRTAVPVRPAIFGAIAGVLGVLAAFTFSTGVSDAAANPERFGQTWHLATFMGFNGRDILPVSAERFLTTIAGDPDVAGVNDGRLGVAHAGEDNAAVSLYSLEPVGARVDTVLTDGRPPASASEVVLAPQSAAALDARVGSRISFQSGTGANELTVVGIGFVPESPHNDYNSGGWLTRAGWERLFAGQFKFHLVQITLRPGADVASAQTRLNATVTELLGGPGPELGPPEPPDPIAELRQVRLLPVALGVFLVLLAMAAVGHALATAVRRRRHDVAVLRALGMTRWQSRGVVVTQATVLSAIGLVFGVPLGMALGRTAWRAVADYTPLQYVPPLAFWALLLVVPLTLIVANLLAAWPGRQAARLRIGHVLRAE